MLIEDISAENFNVLAEVIIEETITEIDNVKVHNKSQLSRTNIEFYYGYAKKIGKLATTHDQCPDLKEGEGIIFSKFAGFHLSTTNAFAKIIRGHDIVAKFKNINEVMNADNLEATGSRVLVKIIPEKTINEEGIYLGEATDPREAVTQKAIVISCGPTCPEKYVPGVVICFDPFAGNLIVNENYHEQYKSLPYEEILCTLKAL